MRKFLATALCALILMLPASAGASQKLYKVTYVVTGTGKASVVYKDPSGVVNETVRLPFKVTYKFPAGGRIELIASDLSYSPKAKITCEIEQPHVKTIRNSASGQLANVSCV